VTVVLYLAAGGLLEAKRYRWIFQFPSSFRKMNSSLFASFTVALFSILSGLRTKRLHAGLTLGPTPGEMRGLKFEALRRYSVGIICANSSPFADLAAIRPALVPSNKLVGYRAKDYPEYHRWVAKVLGISKTRVVISQECVVRRSSAAPSDVGASDPNHPAKGLKSSVWSTF